MLGIQPYPVMAEILGWLLYAIPVVVFVAWPPGRSVPIGRLRGALAGVGVVGLAVGGTLAWSAPSVATPAPATGTGALRASVVTHHGGLELRTTDQQPLTRSSGGTRMLALTSGALTSLGHITAETYRTTIPGAKTHTRLPVKKVAALNDGRMPLGVVATHGTVAATLATSRVVTAVIEPKTLRVLSVKWTQTQTATLVGTSGQDIAVAKPVRTASTATSSADRAEALAAANADQATLLHRTHRMAIAWLVGLLGAVALLGLALSYWPARRPSHVSSPTATLIKT